MTELKAPARKKKAAEDRDPVLWIVTIASVAILVVLGVAKYQSDQRNKPATPQMALDPRLPDAQESAAGMEAGSYTTLEPTIDDFKIKDAPRPSAASTLSSDCKGLLDEQRLLETRLRRPHGEAQGKQYTERLEEISTAAQRLSC